MYSHFGTASNEFFMAGEGRQARWASATGSSLDLAFPQLRKLRRGLANLLYFARV